MLDQAVNPYAPPIANLDSGATQVSVLTMATAGSRLAATSIDGLLMLPIIIPCFRLATLLPPPGEAPRSTGREAVVWGVVALLYFLAVSAYQFVLLSKRGQTVGKRAMNIRIVKLDGSRPGFLHAVLLRIIVNGLPGAIPHVGRLFALIDILFIFRADRRCIHDIIAGTRVVKAEAPPLR